MDVQVRSSSTKGSGGDPNGFEAQGSEGRIRQARAAARRPRIAIVDDYPDAAAMLAVLVKAWLGYDTQAFTSGRDFLASLKATPPDAVLLDLWMPAPNGREILRHLREHGMGGIPVVIMSAAGDAAITEAIAAGAVAGVRKPVEPASLISVLKDLLEPKKRAGR